MFTYRHCQGQQAQSRLFVLAVAIGHSETTPTVYTRLKFVHAIIKIGVVMKPFLDLFRRISFSWLTDSPSRKFKIFKSLYARERDSDSGTKSVREAWLGKRG